VYANQRSAHFVPGGLLLVDPCITLATVVVGFLDPRKGDPYEGDAGTAIRSEGSHNDAMRDAIITPQWQDFYEATGIPAAVRVGQSVRLTGHTGTRSDGSFSADLAEQSRQTFENIADTLAAAGCSWADVEEITAYHVGLQAQGDLVLEVAGQFMSKPFPAWSAIGVTELYEPDAVVEIRVIATIPTGA
jgi:enamine deaminase RidA (YjgF/YER057c/UK114 family)